MKTYGIALFHTTSAVLQAEKEILKAGLDIKLIPTPRELSSDCGISIRFDWTISDKIENILDSAAIEYRSVRLMGEKK